MKEKEEKLEKKMLTGKQVEQVYGINAGTLANWRSQKTGPPYIKRRGRIYYPIDEFEEWMAQGMVNPKNT